MFLGWVPEGCFSVASVDTKLGSFFDHAHGIFRHFWGSEQNIPAEDYQKLKIIYAK